MFSDQDDSEDLSQNSPGKQAKTDSAPNTDRVPGVALKERSITLAPQKNKKQFLWSKILIFSYFKSHSV